MPHDQDMRLASDHLRGFAQDDFHEARILQAACRHLARTGGHLDFGEVCIAGLRFGHDLLTHDQHVVVLQRERMALERRGDQRCQRRMRRDLRYARECGERDGAGTGRSERRVHRGN